MDAQVWVQDGTYDYAGRMSSEQVLGTYGMQTMSMSSAMTLTVDFGEFGTDGMEPDVPFRIPDAG